MEVTLQPDEECLCQSGIRLRDCCGGNGQLFRAPAEIELPGNRTGYAHPRCYAKSLNDCSRDRSREHIFSKNILDKMGGPLTVSGLAWMGNKEMKLAANSLVANVLCKRHNTALSQLDTRAGQFFQELRAAEEYLASTTVGSHFCLFNGNDMERWLLKVALGLSAANWAEHSSAEQKVKNADYWVNILFGDAPFPDRFGLYTFAEIGYEAKALNSIQASLISNTNDGIYGLEFVMVASKFVLPLTLFPDSFNPDSALAKSVYRPGQLIMNKKDAEVVLVFSWDKPGSKAIVMEYHNT